MIEPDEADSMETEVERCEFCGEYDCECVFEY